MTTFENRQKAWEKFIATGKIEYYLKSVDTGFQRKKDETIIAKPQYENKKSLRSIYEAEC